MDMLSHIPGIEDITSKPPQPKANEQVSNNFRAREEASINGYNNGGYNNGGYSTTLTLTLTPNGGYNGPPAHNTCDGAMQRLMALEL